jgi:hypothetical protein
LLGSLGLGCALNLGLNNGGRLNSLDGLSGGWCWGVRDLGGSSINLGLGSGGLGAVLGSKELSELEVILLLGRGRNGLCVVSLGRWLGGSSLSNDRCADLGLLKRLGGLGDGLILLDGCRGETRLVLLLLGGGGLELLDERSEDGSTLLDLGLLLGDGSRAVINLGSLLSRGNNGSDRLGGGLLGWLYNIIGVDGSSGGDWNALVHGI